jgi:hypothetical protein
VIQESLAVAAKTEVLKPSELSAVVVKTTVQPKNAAYPTFAHPLSLSYRVPTQKKRQGTQGLCVLRAGRGMHRQGQGT